MKFEDYKEIIEKHLMDFMPDVAEQSKVIQEAMEYSLGAGGKRLRPILVLATCKFCGGDINDALPYALAVEYIHTYSLIHDDLPCIDNDDLRRGKPTNHAVYGDAMATLAGDGLLNLAFEGMLTDLKETVANEKDIKILRGKIFAAKCIASASGVSGMVAGQVADILAEGKDISPEELSYINKNKTGAIIKAAVKAGAYIGGADEQKFSDLEEYGKNLGYAFQIRDDILDVIGTTAELGKNVGHDMETNKATYPALFGLEKSQELLKEASDKARYAISKHENADFFVELISKMETRMK